MLFGHGVGAVEDCAAHSQVLGQVFDRFSLAGARRSSRRTPQSKLHGSGQGHDAPVGQRRDAQPALQPLEFLTLLLVPSALLDPNDLGLVVLVEPQL